MNAAVETLPSLLPGVNILLMGPTGVGKTHSIGTLVDQGIDVFVMYTENGLESLLGYWTDRGKEVPANLHWHILDAPAAGFTELMQAAKDINEKSYEALTKMQDPNRGKHNQFVSLLQALTNFKDHRTGAEFGPVDTWGPDRVLVLDSLSGINPIAFSLVVGAKPVKSPGDYMVAQDQIEKLLRKLTDGCRCHFIVLAHVDREVDQVFGGVKIMVQTLGAKLAPKLPPMFSDVVLAQREGTSFTWSTAALGVDLKARNLPVADKIAPSFEQVLNKWKSRGGRISPKVQK